MKSSVVQRRSWVLSLPLFVLASLVGFGFGTSAFATPVARGGEVLIVRNPVSADINSMTSSNLHDQNDRTTGFERVFLPSKAEIGIASETTQDISELEQYCAQLKSQGIAKLCSPNFKYAASVLPNDPGYQYLYGMSKISAPQAWGITTGSADVVVAVIDTGVQYTHPDLSENIWVNSGEIPNDGIDNDGNGYIDDVHGYDFVTGDSDPSDENGHGTHVSGTIGAVGNNNYGVVGVNHTVSIQALRVLGASGSGYTSDIISAVNYAAANGASVINMSLGGPGYSEVFEDAIRSAGTHGVLVVVAAGNEAADNDSTPTYPASYALPNMITVAATDDNDELADFSNYGASTVQIAAPGVDILSTVPTNQFAYFSGTSMATPHLAGAAALIKAANPDLSALSLRALILDTGDTLSGLGGVVSTGKRLNIGDAVAAAVGATPIPDPTPTVNSVSIASSKIGSRKYRILSFAHDAYGERVSAAKMRIECTEVNGSKRSLRRTGYSNSSGMLSASFTFSSRTSKAMCRVTALDFGKSSRKLSLKVKR